MPTASCQRWNGRCPPTQPHGSCAVAAAEIEPARLAAPFLDKALSVLTHDGRPAFDLGITHIDSFIEQNRDVVFEGVEAERQAEGGAGSQRAQRLYRISTGADSFKALLASNFQSALDIARIPQEMFVREFGAAMGGDAAASCCTTALCRWPSPRPTRPC